MAAASSGCGTHVAAALSADPSYGVRDKMVRHPDGCRFLRDSLAGDREWRVRAAVAFWGDVSDATLLRLVDDPDPTVRSSLTQRSDGGVDALLSRLAEDPDPVVRGAVVTTGRCDEGLLAGFAVDPDHSVRIHVASLWYPTGHGNCPPRLLAQLAGDTSRGVRRAVAANPDAPEEVLARLGSDPERDVRNEAALKIRSVRVLERLAVDERWEVRDGAARHISAPERVLQHLCDDPAVAVRVSLARRGRCLPAIVERLASDEHPAVRRAVAERADLPAALFLKLRDDPDVDVRSSARTRPSHDVPLPDAG